MIAGCLALAGCGGDDDGGETTATPEASSEEAAAPEEPATLDTAAVEDEFEKMLDGLELGGAPATIYPPGGGPPEEISYGGGKVEVKSVSCPDDVPLSKGESFDCEIDLSKGGGSAEVTELDDEGKQVSYKLDVTTEGCGVETETKLNGKLDL